MTLKLTVRLPDGDGACTAHSAWLWPHRSSSAQSSISVLQPCVHGDPLGGQTRGQSLTDRGEEPRGLGGQQLCAPAPLHSASGTGRLRIPGKATWYLFAGSSELRELPWPSSATSGVSAERGHNACCSRRIKAQADFHPAVSDHLSAYLSIMMAEGWTRGGLVFR